MLKVAFYLENKDVPNVDLSRPELGNPGCGGTTYLFSALPKYIQELNSNTISPILLANVTENLLESVQNYQVEDLYKAASFAKELACDFFVYRPRRELDVKFLNLIDGLELKTIGWAHITPKSEYLGRMAKTKYFKALVCVEHEQHELARDSKIWSKLTYIVNGFDVEGFQLPNPPKKEQNLVVYLGALVPQKGFHLLAKVWPRVLAKNPKAKLAVIGTGSLYNADAKLGPWGIADNEYETKHITPFLSDENGQPHSSVIFLGKLGIEKKDILYKATVGVVNPTGQTENCPGSALEFQACSTPVVSGAFYGMLDTVQHDITGYLGRNEEDLVSQICTLLQDTSLVEKLGKNATKFVQDRYNYSLVVNEWEELFQRLDSNKPIKRTPIKKNILQHSKILILINSCIQKTIGRFVSWPSIIDMKVSLFRKYTRILNRSQRKKYGD